MAFGLQLGGVAGKLALTIFRIIAIMGIIYWLRITLKKGTTNVAIWGISLILAGAIGNVLDSLYYGVIFSDSLGRVAEFMPVWGGDYFTFFRPIFNLADFAISTGVGLLFLFQRSVFK